MQEPGDLKYYPVRRTPQTGDRTLQSRPLSDWPNGYFRDAVEKAPKDVAAWVGLAASYDRLARFDLADRAYASAIQLAGETTEILNNLGYSYMLRGDFKAARKKFLKAYAREPDNPRIANNLRLLDSSYRFVQRSSGR